MGIQISKEREKMVATKNHEANGKVVAGCVVERRLAQSDWGAEMAEGE